MAVDEKEVRAAGVQTDLSSNTENPPAADVNITECKADDIGFMTASGEILNHSSKRSNYMISVNYEDPSGTRIAEGHAFINNVEPGQKALYEAPSLQEASGAFTCKLTSVERLAS